MVLEARLIHKILLATTIFISTGCIAGEDNITDRAKVEGHTLTLKMFRGTCLLDIDSRNKLVSKTLSVKPPCYFLRQNSQKPQSFSYKDVGVLSTIIVVDSQISDEKREKWGIDQVTVCGESRQGILFKKSGIVVTEKTLDGGVVCKDKGADEKDFWYFAH